MNCVKLAVSREVIAMLAVAVVFVLAVGAFMYLVVRGADKQNRACGDGDDSHSFAAG